MSSEKSSTFVSWPYLTKQEEQARKLPAPFMTFTSTQVGMSQAAIQHDQSQYSTPLQAYQNLTEVISDIATEIENNEKVKYSVVWETKSHNHGSEYRVIDTKPLALEDTLIIEGQSRGGRYQVVPRGSGPAVIRYLQKDGTVGWEQKASELIIMYGRFEWKPDKGGTLIDRLRDRF
jgi:hypothetical protein